MSKKLNLWTDEEIEILKTYYPKEGWKTNKRLKGRTKYAVIGKTQKLGIKSNKKRVFWQLEEELVADFYFKYKGLSFNMVVDILQILSQHGFTEHGHNTVDKKIENYSYLETGVGLSHLAKQTRKVYNKKIVVLSNLI